jgi:NAD(P)-dependent dehydrogenase (short-subunit alcohol dehydrogenase family)
VELRGKVALVTGPGSRIGAATTQLFARERATVGVLSHTGNEAQETVARIQQSGGAAMPLIADVAEADRWQQAINDLSRAYGRLDVVLANAEIKGVWAPIDGLEPEEWDWTINTNLRGAFLTLHFSAPHLKRAVGRRRGGHHLLNQRHPHVQPCWRHGLCLHKGRAGRPRADSRAGICAAQDPGERDLPRPDRDWDPAKHPTAPHRGGQGSGGISGRQDPLPGDEVGKGEDIAKLVQFLESDRSRYITGSPLWIDGTQWLLVG